MKPRGTVNREWLQAAVEFLRPRFQAVGFPLPVHLSVWRGKCAHPSFWGQHWPGNVMVSSRIRSRYKAYKVLLHELCHAAVFQKLGRLGGHGSEFKRCAVRMGLTEDGHPSNEAAKAECLKIRQLALESS